MSAIGFLKENKAFTLLELLLVVIIMGVLVGLTIPNVKNSFTNIQLSDKCKDIIALIRYGQQQAILNHRNYRLNLKIDKGQYWLTIQKDPVLTPEIYQRLKTSIGKIHTLPRHTQIKEITPTANYITFYPSGDLDQVQIYLASDTGKTYCLSTTRMVGHVLVEEAKSK